MKDIVISFKSNEWDDYTVLNNVITQVNELFDAVDASIYLTVYDTSLANLTSWNDVQDASLVIVAQRNTAQDTSLGNLSHWDVTQDASFATVATWNTAQDASLLTRLHIYAGTFGGLKDASGANGDIIFADADTAAYLKLGGAWLKIDASIYSFG